MPTFWTPDENGDLQYDSVRPEIKEVLGVLRQWYSEGLLAPDFFTFAPWQNSGTHIGGNLAGLMYSPAFGAVYGLPDSVANDPEARWAFGDIPMGPSGIKKKAWSNPVPDTVYVLPQRLRACRPGLETNGLVGGAAAEPEEPLPWL